MLGRRTDAIGRFLASSRRAGSILLHALSGAGCIMAAMAAGMNRNPLIAWPMLLAAASCFWRVVLEVREGAART